MSKTITCSINNETIHLGGAFSAAEMLSYLDDLLKAFPEYKDYGVLAVSDIVYVRMMHGSTTKDQDN